MPVSTTITQGQVVQFKMSGTHNVVPFPGNDAGLMVAFGATTCLKFTSTGTFRFECSVHTFQGTVVVN
jgi:plastocyanin